MFKVYQIGLTELWVLFVLADIKQMHVLIASDRDFWQMGKQPQAAGSIGKRRSVAVAPPCFIFPCFDVGERIAVGAGQSAQLPDSELEAEAGARFSTSC